MMAQTADLQKSLLSWRDAPIVFKQKIQDWKAASWTPEILADILGSQTVQFRVGERGEKDIQWETECKYVVATIKDFLNWQQQQQLASEAASSTFKCYQPDRYWAYMDYKYMSRIFENHPQQLKAVDWSVFGFDGRDGADSTLWLGSPGAYTVCHCDTYGCNLVAQLYGRKRWVLFPPQQTNLLYPTRLPYEESSIFSLVNIPCPDVKQHPKFCKANPYIVTLEPGDVLFVPRHWWHYVENLDTSISVNSWIDMEGVDDVARLHEAVTRTVVCSLMSSTNNQSDNSWLNPTETLTDEDTNLAYISQSLTVLQKKLHNVADSAAVQTPPKSATCSSSHCCCDRNTSMPCDHDNLTRQEPNATVLQPCSFAQFLKTMERENSGHTGTCSGNSLNESRTSDSGTQKADTSLTRDSVSHTKDSVSCVTLPADQEEASVSKETEEGSTKAVNVSMADLVDCITHPDVIHLISDKLLEIVNVKVRSGLLSK